MKYIFIFVMIILQLSAAEQHVQVDQVECQRLIDNGNIAEAQRRGCCSWHGGVCGCNNSGRVECCDGTLSPTCTCKGNEQAPNDKIK